MENEQKRTIILGHLIGAFVNVYEGRISGIEMSIAKRAIKMCDIVLDLEEQRKTTKVKQHEENKNLKNRRSRTL